MPWPWWFGICSQDSVLVWPPLTGKEEQRQIPAGRAEGVPLQREENAFAEPVKSRFLQDLYNTRNLAGLMTVACEHCHHRDPWLGFLNMCSCTSKSNALFASGCFVSPVLQLTVLFVYSHAWFSLMIYADNSCMYVISRGSSWVFVK